MKNCSCVSFDVHAKEWLLAVDFWLSTRQLELVFYVSNACFGFPRWSHNQKFQTLEGKKDKLKTKWMFVNAS